ncbi:esterase [Corynebacterium suranareeae]|uniref:Esterase n=1 Tax=Corynebacterium suranareeae TaxID=2506452 RepID=A0A160PSH6_9CORY|nr:alpha/beta hydrolase-fold protein [Corynebacterium suranareeae]BAU95350.1 esterase [Corynebacterium suranareeae]
MNEWRTVSLVDSTALTVIICVAVLTVAATAYGIVHKPRKRTLGALISAVALTLSAWVIIEKLWRPFPDPNPWTIYLAAGVAVFSLLSVFFRTGRTRIWMAGLTVIALINSAAVVNLNYQPYPTLGSFNPVPAAVSMSYADFESQSTAPTMDDREVGALVQVPLAGTTDDSVSDFNARDAYAYIPPAYWTHPDVQLPVLVLMAGNPGQPDQWFSSGDADQTADNFQATHDGISPIVISVDGTGSFSGNPACVDSDSQDVMTYLSQDVPMLIKQKFRVNQDQRTWTIGGLSYGGTCALQIMTNHPKSYGSFLDFSGQAEPTLGTREQTVDQLFGGDEDAFKAVNPEDLLNQAIGSRDHTYSGISGKFIAGSNDESAVTALSHLNNLSNQAGMSTTFDTVAGGHSFQVWRVALANTFDWVAQRGGVQV